MGAQGEEGGDRQRERDRTEHSWYVMEPWVIFPIGAAAQKPKLCQKQSLDASLHLYMRVCPSIGPSNGPSARLSVGPSVGDAFVKNKEKSSFLSKEL